MRQVGPYVEPVLTLFHSILNPAIQMTKKTKILVQKEQYYLKNFDFVLRKSPKNLNLRP